MTTRRTIHLLPVLLITIFLTLPVSSESDQSYTVVLENQGSRPVWFDVHEKERRIAVYPWGLEGYRRITSGRSEVIEGPAGAWEVEMRNASGGVGFKLNDNRTINVRFRSPGEDKINTSVYREDVRIAFHEFEKSVTSFPGRNGRREKKEDLPDDRNRSGSDADPSDLERNHTELETRSGSSSSRDQKQVWSYSKNKIDYRSRRSRHHHRKRYRSSFYRGFRNRYPCSSYRYRHHYRSHGHHGSRFRFRVRFHLGGYHRRKYHDHHVFRHHGISFFFR